MRALIEFLDKIEGDGYGGMASFEIARTEAREALAALLPFMDALILAECAEPTDPTAMLNAARQHVTLYEFAKVRSALP